MLTDEQLNDITERNREAKKLKKAASPTPWGFDGPGYINPGSRVLPGRRIGILIRPWEWFWQLREKFEKHDCSTVDLLAGC